MKYHTPGAKQLSTWLSEIGMTHATAAGVFGVAPSAVSNWCAGVARPSPVMRAICEEMSGIKQIDWLTSMDLMKLRNGIQNWGKVTSET